MASYKSLQMADTVIGHAHISQQESLFGIIDRLVYTPTGSHVKVIRNTYSVEALPHLRAIIEAQGEDLDKEVSKFNFTKQAIGNVVLDALVSTDRQFAALQLTQFGDYKYRPVTDVAFFEGDSALTVTSIL